MSSAALPQTRGPPTLRRLTGVLLNEEVQAKAQHMAHALAGKLLDTYISKCVLPSGVVLPLLFVTRACSTPACGGARAATWTHPPQLPTPMPASTRTGLEFDRVPSRQRARLTRAVGMMVGQRVSKKPMIDRSDIAAMDAACRKLVAELCVRPPSPPKDLATLMKRGAARTRARERTQLENLHRSFASGKVHSASGSGAGNSLASAVNIALKAADAAGKAALQATPPRGTTPAAGRLGRRHVYKDVHAAFAAASAVTAQQQQQQLAQQLEGAFARVVSLNRADAASGTDADDVAQAPQRRNHADENRRPGSPSMALAALPAQTTHHAVRMSGPGEGPALSAALEEAAAQASRGLRSKLAAAQAAGAPEVLLARIRKQVEQAVALATQMAQAKVRVGLCGVPHPAAVRPTFAHH
jgi:hypothetical protein